MSACMLTEGPFYQCCCNCRNHLQDNYHCTIHTKMREDSGDKCICDARKGWICVGMVFDDPVNGRAHSEWPEHSVGCEMYTPIVKRERPPARAVRRRRAAG